MPNRQTERRIISPWCGARLLASVVATVCIALTVLAQEAPSSTDAHARSATLDSQRTASPQAVSLSAPWQAIGPAQVSTVRYGLITGRVTSLALDPNDPTGNTLYLGSTGGGVWKSTNAAAATNAVRFTALTDTLPAFSANAGTAAIPSLSIGALTVQPGGTGVVLAGTGDPNNASDSYYGVGVLRSQDNGVTWSLLQTSSNGAGGTHTFTGEAFAGFAWSTATPQLVVAAVSASAQGSIVKANTQPASVRGLYYSTDAGATWHIATVRDGATTVQSGNTDYSSFEGNAATAVVWNPLRARFYAAVRYHGYYESSDGITWTRLTNQPGNNLTTANCPSRAGLDGLVGCPIFRGALATQPVSGDLFALTVDANNADIGIWQDTCNKSGSACGSSTVAWSAHLDSSPLDDISGNIPRGDYNLTLAAMPAATALSTSDTLLFAGTTDIFRCSLAGGCTLRNTTNAGNSCATPARVAPAQHAMEWQLNPSDAARPRIFFGNDGGIWRSLDGVRQLAAACSADDATHFDNLDGGLGSLAEVTSLASHPSDANVVLAALGNNGSADATISAQATDASPWDQLSAGESATVAIDQTDGNRWLVQSGAGVALHTCNNGAACTAADFAGPASIGPTQVNGDVTADRPPAILDPALTTNVILGTCRVWRGPTSGGSSWSSNNNIGPALSGPAGSACTRANGAIRSLAAGGDAIITNATQTSGSPVLYAGIAGTLSGGGPNAGHLFVNTSANTATSTTAWSDTTGNPVTNDSQRFNANGFDISSIAVDRSDATGRTVYATIAGFGVPHVYRSTNAGASWTNISANLPNAPANSIAVDPGDANIVYVAMDTGVYVTSAVTSCVSAATGAVSNCWSVYGSGLPNAPVVSLLASSGFAVPGSNDQGTLRAGTYGRGIWQTSLLTAGQPAQAIATLSSASLTFAAQAQGSTSTAQTITVTNTGSVPLSITSAATTGPFAESDTCSGQTLAPNATCSVQVTFTPAATGAATGSLQVFANVQGGSVSTTLSGTGSGTAPFNPVLLPTAVDFGTQATGTTSAVRNITISNTGIIAGGIGAASITGDFIITANTCGTSLATQTGCTVSIAFTPTATGMRTGIFTIATDSGSRSATLKGIGTLSATDALSASSLNFGPQQANTSSVAQTITLTNTGDAALTLISAQVLTGDFTVSNGCGNSLAARSSCSLSVAFAPKGVGALTGTLQISDVLRVQTVALSGTGLAGAGVSLLPARLTFANTGVGVAGGPQTITLTNNGGAPLQITAINVTGDFGIIASVNTCLTSAPLAAGDACSFPVAFLPSVAGARSGSVAIVSSNAVTQTSLLTGTGIDFTFATNGNTAASISNGESATFPLLLRPALPTADTVTYACSGAPANTRCTITSQYTDLSAVSTVTVTLLTGATPKQILMPIAAIFAMLLPLAWRTRTLRNTLLCATLCVLSLCITACGAGRRIAAAGDGSTTGTTLVTPSGTYTITASATAAGLTKSAIMTLTVK